MYILYSIWNDLEKSRWNETGLAISYKSKKTAAA